MSRRMQPCPRPCSDPRFSMCPCRYEHDEDSPCAEPGPQCPGPCRPVEGASCKAPLNNSPADMAEFSRLLTEALVKFRAGSGARDAAIVAVYAWVREHCTKEAGR